jgi:regulatory protein
VLDALEEAGLLSDARAAEAVVHARASRHGVRRLRQTLQARALPPDLIEATLEGARATEADRARDLWRRRFGTAPADAREHARQMRFLLARGFEAATAQRIIRSAAAADEADTPDPGDPPA